MITIGHAMFEEKKVEWVLKPKADKVTTALSTIATFLNIIYIYIYISAVPIPKFTFCLWAKFFDLILIISYY